MGLYLNPPTDKYEWCQTYCEEHLKMSDFLFDSVADDEFLVVAVNNGIFVACGVAYDQQEYETFTDPDPKDTRAKEYFIMKRDIIKPYCDGWDKYVRD